jgi:hypothetical protein
VSKQVAQLEEMLCHKLFERVRQRLYLSPAGSLYLAEVHKILTQVDISSRYILTYGGETEVLRIATQPTFGDRWLYTTLLILGVVYISVAAVTAAIGSALTAGHFWKRAPKVTKRALAPPLGTSPRLGVPVIRH